LWSSDYGLFTAGFTVASVIKRGDKWVAQVCVKGQRRQKTFALKREAVAWAAEQTSTILVVSAGGVPDITLRAVLDRYGREVTPKKRGARSELLRLGRISRDTLGDVRLPVLTARDLSAWRDRRLGEVMPSSVLRDMTLLSHVFTVAVREWKLLPDSPLTGVRRPKDSNPRDRRISEDEIERLLYGLGYMPNESPKTISARVGAAFLFAIETGMRAGEICGLKWSDIAGVVAKLDMTKNGFSRSVPLSKEALRIISLLPRTNEKIFNLTSQQLEVLFRKARSKSLIQNLHFHDTRHEAITRLARKLDVLDLARMVGIRDLKILMVYYNATPDDIASRLE
jgi:integrase